MSFSSLVVRFLLAAVLTISALMVICLAAGAAGITPYWGEFTIKRGAAPDSATLDLYLYDPAHRLSAPLVRNLPRSIRPNIAWSPDGRRVRFTNWIDSACGYFCEYDVQTGRLAAAPENRLLAGYRQITRSPGNQQIAYADDTTVYVLDIASERSRRLMSDVWMPQIGWSPDGGSLALVTYQSPDSYNGALWRVDLAAGLYTRLNCACTVTGSPIWSPDGSTIVFEGYEAGAAHQLYAADAAFGDVYPLTHFPQTPPLDFIEGSWSPDGSLFLFQMMNRQSGAQIIYLVGAAGGAVRRLTEGTMPTWSQAGDWITFIQQGADANLLYMMRPDGGDLRFLTTTAASSVDSPRWRP